MAEIAALEVVLRSRSAQVGAKKVQTEIKKVGTAATAAQAKVGASTAAMGGAFAKLKSMIFSVQALLLTLGIGIGLVATIGTLKEFEYTMAGVRAVTGASIEEFGLLTDKARELGATTIFAATEAAEGMRLLGLAGFSVSEALGAVEGTLNLAAAGSLGLGEASAITANIIRSFRLEAEKASEIADILAKTATNANTTVGGLGNAFSFVGAVARAANQSVADTAAVLGVLTDAGFDASRAGTGLRRVLGEILVGNEDLVARLPELGLTIEDINLQTNSMVDVFQKLAPLAMDAAFALEVFGQRGGPAFLAVVGQADRMELLADKTNKAGGAAKEIAEILTNTLQGSIKLLKSAVEELILALGDMGLTMWMKTLADNIRGVITVFNGMGETLGENQARFEAMAETLRAYTIFVAALGTVHLIKLAASFQFLTRAVKAATLAMMRNPFMLIGVAIAAVITWLFTLRNRVTEATGEIFKMGDAYGEIFHQIWGLVKDVITLWGVFGNTAEDAGEKADEAFTGVGAAIVFHVLSTINDAIRDVRLLGIWLSEIPHMMRNWGEISDEGFQKLLDIAEPLGARAGKRFAAGFKKEVDPRMLAEFEVAIKDVLLQAQGLERTVVTISSLNMGTEQAKELKLLQVEAFEASKSVTALAQEIEAAGGAEKLSADELERFSEQIKQAKTRMKDAGRNLQNFQERLLSMTKPAGSDAVDVIEKLNDQLKVLSIFGEKAQFVMGALAEANLDTANATDKHRVKVEGLAKKVWEAQKAQDAYKFVIDNSRKPLEDLNERLRLFDVLLAKGKITQEDYTRATALTNAEIAELQTKFRDMDLYGLDPRMAETMKGLNEALQDLTVFGDQAQFTLSNLRQAGLENAEATDKNRIAVEQLSDAVWNARQMQETYAFAQQHSEQQMTNLNARFGYFDSLLESGAINQREYGRLVGLTKLEMQELNEQFRQDDIMAASADLSAFQQGMVGATVQMGFTQENMRALGATATNELGTALTDALKNPAEAGDIFLNALARIGDKILELAMQELLLRPLMNTLSGIGQQTNQAGGGLGGLLSGLGGGGGGGGGGGWLGAIGGIASLFGSKGGYVDDLPGGVAPARAFRHARRFKMGGAADNIPAMLNRREAVVPLGGGRAIPVEMKGGGGPQVVMNITTPNPEAFRRSQGHILAQAAGQLRGASMRNN